MDNRSNMIGFSGCMTSHAYSSRKKVVNPVGRGLRTPKKKKKLLSNVQ